MSGDEACHDPAITTVREGGLQGAFGLFRRTVPVSFSPDSGNLSCSPTHLPLPSPQRSRAARPAMEAMITMHIGATFPQTEIVNDPHAIRDWAQAVEGLGYDHILVSDYVLGAGRATRPNWRGNYSSDDPFHEVFVLYGYLAALTSRVE